jgi:calcineurin-like phosphoesterase family protein
VPRLRAAAALLIVLVLIPGAGAPVAGSTEADPVLLAAGDVARCDESGDETTAVLLDENRGTVAMLGDGAYANGTEAEYRDCYGPTWGKHKDRTRPVPGNHDYVQAGGPGYYGFFGSAAGDKAKGFYSYDLGAWHVVALNSNCHEVGGCGAGSPQDQWLEADLASTAARCVLAYWHHPRFFSSAPEPGVTKVDPTDVKMTPVWRTLQAAKADVVLSAHVHVYERFARQDSAGQADPSGLREFVVGTGGGKPGVFTGDTAPNSEVRGDQVWGVLRLDLHPEGYDWHFLPAGGGTFTDSGTEACSAK